MSKIVSKKPVKSATKLNRKSRRQLLVPTISKALLLEAAKAATQWGYNRQLCEKKIARISAGRYQVVMVIPHYHAFFEPVAEHRRLMVQIGKSYCFADVPMEFYQRVVSESAQSKNTNFSANKSAA